MSQKWYVARTEPRAEFQAVEELTRDGYEIFFPRIRAQSNRPQATRPARAEEPMFPGYLFIKCDPATDGWPTFRHYHRIAGWVRFDHEVPYLPEGVMEELIQRWEVISSQGGLPRRFTAGEKVRVLSGNLESLAEVLEEAKSPNAKATVLMHFMGRLIHAQVPWADLRPADENPPQMPALPRRTRGRRRWIGGFGPRRIAVKA
ncbi:MAG: hypothetical protein FI731_01885 [SAR202 cluster bacterium]|nr:hypothetical protein [Gemmatimonadota bacterium]MQF94413.1 hypothetical protein [SAR202 cluster bacterium]|tara:strand:- start:5571 stop:6179 length:609 start_codon:yes stop_codon:yes gene_type:complete